MLAASPAALAATVSEDSTTPVRTNEDDAIITVNATLSVTCDIENPDNREAIEFDQPDSDVTVNENRTAELTAGDGCGDDAEDLATIRGSGSGDDAAPSSGTIEINGTVNGTIVGETNGTAIFVGDDVGGQTTDDNDTPDDETDDTTTEHLVEVSVGTTGEVNGDVYLGSGGNHTFVNSGTVNGTVAQVGRTSTDYANDGTHNAGDSGVAIEMGDNLNGTDRTTSINNLGTLNGDVRLGGGASHNFQSSGTYTGDITVDQGAGVGETSAVIGNFGTFTGNITVTDGTGGEVTDEDTGAVTLFRTQVQNSSGAIFTGDVTLGNGADHTFTNSGSFIGRVTAGDGDNAFTFTDGTFNILLEDDFLTNGAVIAGGAGDDSFVMTGGQITPLDTSDAEMPLAGTLIDLGTGNDRVELAFGSIFGAETAFDLGDGDDEFAFVASSSTGAFVLSGTVLGGAGTDIFETSGQNADTPFTVDGSIDLVGFESFTAAQNSTIIDLAEGNTLDVWGGTLTVNSGATLTLVTGLAASDEQTEFTDMLGLNGTPTNLFDAQSTDIAGTFTVEQPSFLIGDEGVYTVSDGGLSLFRVQNDGTDVINGAILIDDLIPDDDEETENTSDGTPRVVLEGGSSLGLSMDSKDVMGRDDDGNAVETGEFTVVVATDVITRETETTTVVDDNGTPDDTSDDTSEEVTTVTDTVVNSADDLSVIGLFDEDPFYKFAYNFTDLGNGFNALSIIATRTPGFAQTILDNSADDALGSIGTVLDQDFELCTDGELDDPSSFCGALRALGLRPDSEIISGLAQAAPNRMAGGHQSIMRTQNQANDLVAGRTNLVRAGTVGPRTVRHSGYQGDHTGMSAGDGGSVWAGNHAWVQGFAGSLDQDAVGNNPGFDANLYGGLLGLDRRLNRTWLVGLYGGYGFTDIDGKDTSSDQLEVTSYLGGAYASWFNSSSSAEVILSGGYDQYEGSRIGFLSNRVNRDYNGYHLGLRGAADTNLTLFDRLLLTPSASLQYTYLNEDAYEETGAASSVLSVDERTAHSFQSRLGARLQAPGRVGNNFLLPYFALAWTHEFIDTTDETRASFVNGQSGASFTTPELDIPSDALNAGLGLDFTTLGGTTVSVGYDFMIQEEAMAHTGQATVRIAF